MIYDDMRYYRDYYDGEELYIKEKNFIAKKQNCKVREIEIDDMHPSGEIIIYIKEKFIGYIDNEFYVEMESNG